jgi:hypothetical protein
MQKPTLEESLVQKFAGMTLVEQINECATAIVRLENHTSNGMSAEEIAEAQLTVKLLQRRDFALA